MIVDPIHSIEVVQKEILACREQYDLLGRIVDWECENVLLGQGYRTHQAAMTDENELTAV
jgi:hypothetical protein